MTLQRALLGMLAIVVLAGLVPAGLVLDRRLARALEERVRTDLLLAPRVLADRHRANADMMMMHAKEFAHVTALAEALAAGDRLAALEAAVAARESLAGGEPLIITRSGESWAGPAIDSSVTALTREGQMPVVMQRRGSVIHNVALAPVQHRGRWVGAAGVASPLDERAAEVIAGLTRSEVVVVATGDGAAADTVAASTLDPDAARAVALALASWPSDSVTREIVAGGRRLLAARAPLEGAGTIIFSRALAAELAVLPELRRVAMASAVAALVVALALGALLAVGIARPVSELSAAAAALGRGEFAAPLPRSRIMEVARVARAFDEMRRALAARLDELRRANAELSDRNERLIALQADLLQRERLAATGRLVAQLAHEIRNPVANLRNCLELIRRRVEHDAEAREFADLAIDELLRMHELAEQMLDLNRPRDPAVRRCDPVAVAREVVHLSTLGATTASEVVLIDHVGSVAAAIAPDALKQVLQNLVSNALEAIEGRKDSRRQARIASGPARVEIEIARANGEIVIEVRDEGPGIPAVHLPRLFDPFFTTKGAMHGVGLGLFMAEGLVRTAGGRISAGNRTGGGAWFRVELPDAAPEPSPDVAAGAGDVA